MSQASWVSHSRRSGAFAFALILTVGACSSSGTNRAASDGSSASSTTAFKGTPTLTVPGLIAPPRSYKPVFTGAAAAVEKAFRARLADFERKDVSAAFTSQATAKFSRAELLGFMNTYRIRLYRINAIDVKGNTATIEYENAIVGRNLKSDATTTLLGQHDVWTNDHGTWKSVSDVSSSPGIPRDLTTVTVTLRDHAPIVVPAPLPTSDFAFLLKNTGAAAKGVFILGIPADLNVDSLLPVISAIGRQRQINSGASALPDGIIEMGATADIPVHKSGTMVFSGRLRPGRYLLLSRTAENADGPGGLLPKELATFTIK